MEAFLSIWFGLVMASVLFDLASDMKAYRQSKETLRKLEIY